MEEPHESYTQLAAPAIAFAEEFGKLMNILEGDDARGVPYQTMHGKQKEFFSCKETIQFLHKASNCGFDLDLLLGMGNLLYIQLRGALMKSCPFLKSCDPVSYFHMHFT